MTSIKVGVLFSLNGTTAVTERGQHNAALLAIQLVNQNGGVSGKPLVPIVEDIFSDPTLTAKKTEKLLTQDRVVAIIGCYTSACRKGALPVVERNNGILLYPTLYEGEECCRNIFYCGATPNQQLQEFVPWILKHVGNGIYLVGSDYVYPIETNRQVKALIEEHGGTVVGEEYVPLGCSEFSALIGRIKSASPSAVFSTLVGDSVIAFYRQYRDYGIRAADMPICSPITGESEIQVMGAKYGTGHYTSYGYFQSLDTPENRHFVNHYKKNYGISSVVNSVMEGAYFSVFLLAQALEDAQSCEPEAIRRSLLNQSFQAPQGQVRIDPDNQHAWLWSRIGRAREDGQFDIVWESNQSIRPEPWASVLFHRQNIATRKV